MAQTSTTLAGQTKHKANVTGTDISFNEVAGVYKISSTTTSLNNYSLGLANNGAALKRIVAQGVKLMEFPENVWDLFGESAVKAMDKYMDDSLYAQIRESYEISLRGTTSWLDRADRTYVKQRARVYNL